jgi:hypothetical protein
MHIVRPAIAMDPQSFGRAARRALPIDTAVGGLSDDLKLFATTFLAGFLFISILLA